MTTFTLETAGPNRKKLMQFEVGTIFTYNKTWVGIKLDPKSHSGYDKDLLLIADSGFSGNFESNCVDSSYDYIVKEIPVEAISSLSIIQQETFWNKVSKLGITRKKKECGICGRNFY